MKDRTILGHIDCPTCGMQQAMRISEDKNGDPFGYCEANCGQQLRIGGDRRRVRDFFNRYPDLQRRADDAPPAADAPAAAPEPAAKAEPAAPARPKRSAFEDALSILGVQ
jgi:hypothetical protein